MESDIEAQLEAMARLEALKKEKENLLVTHSILYISHLNL